MSVRVGCFFFSCVVAIAIFVIFPEVAQPRKSLSWEGPPDKKFRWVPLENNYDFHEIQPMGQWAPDKPSWLGRYVHPSGQVFPLVMMTKQEWWLTYELGKYHSWKESDLRQNDRAQVFWYHASAVSWINILDSKGQIPPDEFSEVLRLGHTQVNQSFGPPIIPCRVRVENGMSLQIGYWYTWDSPCVVATNNVITEYWKFEALIVSQIGRFWGNTDLEDKESHRP